MEKSSDKIRTESKKTKKQRKSDSKEKSKSNRKCAVTSGDSSKCEILAQQGTQEVSFTLPSEESENQQSESSLSATRGNGTITSAQPNLFWFSGVVDRSSVCPSWLHPTRAYSIFGMAHNDSDQQMAVTSSSSSQFSGQILSGWFQELLLSLGKENLLVVCAVVLFTFYC